MSIKVKAAGTWKTVNQPWVKVAGAYKPATKVYVKVGGTWTETWPLQPGGTGASVVTTAYRNDRIEIDVDWDAPTSGEAAAKYIVTVKIGTSYTTTVEVIAPTTALTLTNGGNGFHTYAGQQVTATLYAQSAAGRNGPTTTSAPVVVSQLPAPPVPTSYAAGMGGCAMSHVWTHAGGRRIDGVELQTQFNGVGSTIVRYDKAVTSANYQSWDVATIGGGTVTTKLRTYGPGGTSAWVTITGTMPSPITTSEYRFYNGYLLVHTAGISPAVEVWYASAANGVWVLDKTVVGAPNQLIIDSSLGWARNGGQYVMLLRPINTVNGWTGRDQWLGWVRKMPNPYYVQPIDSRTRRNNAWRTEDNQEWQGSSSSGQNTAYFLYGNQFFDQLSIGYVGYDIRVSSAQIAMYRENTGGLGSPVKPRLMMHRAFDIYDTGGLGFIGAYDTNAMNRNVAAWETVPYDWVQYYLIPRYDNCRGLGLFHPNTALSGGVSAEYMIFKAKAYGTVEGWDVFTVRIYHDG